MIARAASAVGGAMASRWQYVVIAALVAALAGSGWLLKRAWQDEATASQAAAQYRRSLADQQQAYTELRAQQRRNDQIIADTAADKQRLEARNNELSRQLRNAPDASPEYRACADVPLPGSVVDRLRQQAGRADPNRPANAAGQPVRQRLPGAANRG